MQNHESTSMVAGRCIGAKGLWILITFGIIFLLLNAGINIIMLGHSFPMGVYIGFLPFMILYYKIKKKMPTIQSTALFVTIYMIVDALITFIISSISSTPIDFSLLVEPIFFFPVILLMSMIRRVVKGDSYFPKMFTAFGGIMVILTFACIIPGSPVVNIFDSLDGGTTLKSIFLLYFIPVISGGFGSASLIFGIALLYTREIIIKDTVFYGMIICIAFSLMVFGTAVAWAVLEAQCSSEKQEPK